MHVAFLSKQPDGLILIFINYVASVDTGDGMEIVPVEWNLELTPGGEIVHLTGTVEEVYPQLVDLNPTYDQNWVGHDDETKEEGFITVDKRENDNPASVPWTRSTFKSSNIKCNIKTWASCYYTKNGIDHLRKVKGKPSDAAGKCGRVSYLLQASKTGNPTFVAISTLGGSIGPIDGVAHLPLSPYGGSKAALNWLIRRLRFEEPWPTSFLLHPSLIETDLTIAAMESVKLSEMRAVLVDAGMAKMMKTTDKASRNIGGMFQNYDGTKMPW
ncbi:hypothetical protein NW759_016875 [Fusarium solani]|nr:hypothetical protein NW759_016875 [Fusarium solani]